MDKVRFAEFQNYQHGLMAQGCYPATEQLLETVAWPERFLGHEVCAAIADSMIAVIEGKV